MNSAQNLGTCGWTLSQDSEEAAALADTWLPCGEILGQSTQLSGARARSYGGKETEMVNERPPEAQPLGNAALGALFA